ncbi:MerR family transcriptional regulator [Terrirubrum flagellatum]|uniref:MerR family transcriptional regulator n=1 Tax=Terrirubrum flagellatum TaxID=2895980 RepID=UPI003CC81F68
MTARPMMAMADDVLSTASPADLQAPEFTIGDLAREFGVTLRTLRFYEHRGLLKPRRQGLSRFYDEKAKARLALILKGKQLGFTLTEIRAMLAANERGAQNDLGLSREQMKTQLETLRAERARIEAGIAELEAKLAG